MPVMLLPILLIKDEIKQVIPFTTAEVTFVTSEFCVIVSKLIDLIKMETDIII